MERGRDIIITILDLVTVAIMTILFIAINEGLMPIAFNWVKEWFGLGLILVMPFVGLIATVAG